MKLVLRGPARVTSAEMLLGISRENLLSFEYVDSSGSTSKKINRSEASLIRAFKGHIWHLNATRQSIDNDFMKIDPIGFDNFRISNKWTQLVDMDPNAALPTMFGTSTSAAPSNTNGNYKNKLPVIFKKGIKRDLSLF